MNPRICCICLTANRTAQTARAVKSFLAQTYPEKRLLVWDTGELNRDFSTDSGLLEHIPAEAYREPPLTIGALRNEANAFWTEFDIIAHWDSDDYSAPTRLAEQVAHLQASGADVVGYSDMLFWDTRRSQAWLHNQDKPRYAMGTSMLYWRRTWERKPFPEHTNPGCDDRLWVEGLKVASVSSVAATTEPCTQADHVCTWCGPRMVAEIHGGNTCARITEPSMDWTRVPAWDEKLRSIMAL